VPRFVSDYRNAPFTFISPANSLENPSSTAGLGPGAAETGEAELEVVVSGNTSGFFEGKPHILHHVSTCLIN
jgi:hypothetical protein